MKLNLKNPLILDVYDVYKKTINLSVEETSRLWKKKRFGEEQITISILLGYLDSLCEIAEECENLYDSHPTIDLTYETVKHIPLILAQQYFSYVKSGSYSKEKALEISNKTLAAYFMLLCMNEHMCFPTVDKMNDFDAILKGLGNDINATPNDSWMGHTIKVGPNKEYDLLSSLGTSIRVSASKSFRVRISRLVDLYNQMCGVNLREKGLDDLEMVTNE